MKILHIVGGNFKSGAFTGAYILHKALLNAQINSKILNDNPNKKPSENDKNIIFVNTRLIEKVLNKFFIYLEKIFKSIILPNPRSTFTFSIFGYDITKLQAYKNADIIHIHWLSDGFINLKSISKISKPIVWTMRDMWPFTGGSHYTMEFEKYEKGYLSNLIKNLKKKTYNKKIQFVAISDWLKFKSKKSNVLKDHSVIKIYNNIEIDDFKAIPKNFARSKLKIQTDKKIISYGAQNPQSTRKGWKIFIDTLQKIDKSKYFLLIFGSFWSHKILDDLGIEYKSFGFVDNKEKLNLIYSCSDFFVTTSIQEAFGKTWAEAMACNIPIVCFKNTASAEIIDHKINGYIVDGFDSEKLKVGIDWMGNEVDSRNLDIDKIRQKAQSFDSNKIASEYIDLYLRILKT
mgnify:CR=1 FL=1